MRKKITYTLILLAGFCLTGFAQLPTSFNYQAVARDAGGTVMASKNLTVILGIIQDSAGGMLVWEEEHTVTTNSLGLFNLKIGSGTSTTNGSLSHFDSIEWGGAAYFLKVGIDLGSGVLDIGTTPFMAVPYALYAYKSGNGTGGNQQLSLKGKELSISGGNTVSLDVNDADADSSNELQELSLNGDDLTISKGNTVSLASIGGDADVDSSNELQTLSLNGNLLAISLGNSVSLPASPWIKSGNNVYYKGGDVMIGTSYPFNDSTLLTLTDSTRKNVPVLAYMYGRGADNYMLSSILFNAKINATNGINTAIKGDAAGVSGRDNRGIHGYASNSLGNTGVYGEAAAGSKTSSNNYGVYGVATGTTSGFNIGLFGESNNSSYYNRGLDGRTNGTGQFNEGVFGHSIGTGSGQNKGVYGFVQGSSYVNYGVFGESKGKGSYNIALFGDASGAAATNYALYTRSTNATTNYAAFIDGNLTYTGTLTGPSDIKLKKNIEDLGSSLDLINELHPVSYEYREEYIRKGVNFSKGLQYGFIAQELEEVLPELVTDQKAPIFKQDKEGRSIPMEYLEFKGINYIGLIPVLTGAIKEQQSLINVQKEEIQQLKDEQVLILEKLAKLEKSISELKEKE